MKKTLIVMLIAATAFAVAAVAFATDDAAKPPTSFDKPQAAGVKATCPVMNSAFTIDDKTPSSQYQGRYYYFCCAGCKASFDKDPAKYLGKK
jgi:YHS domain-containing protein